MKTKIFSIVFAVIMLFTSTTMAFASQGTNGDELHVIEAQQLEIQLGTEWAGVEFMLRTDAGIYPDAILVDENGVLSLEIGGSKTYILSCLQSSVVIPEYIFMPIEETDVTYVDGENGAEVSEEKNVVPLKHIVMFGAGCAVAIGILIAIAVLNKKRQIVQDDEENDDF